MAGWRSCCFARRQPQARQKQLAVLGVPHVAGIRHYRRIDGAQSLNDFSRLVEPSHVGVAGGEIAIGIGARGSS